MNMDFGRHRVNRGAEKAGCWGNGLGVLVVRKTSVITTRHHITLFRYTLTQSKYEKKIILKIAKKPALKLK